MPLGIDMGIMIVSCLPWKVSRTLASVLENAYVSQGNFPGVKIICKDNPPALRRRPMNETCIDTFFKKCISHFQQSTFQCVYQRHVSLVHSVRRKHSGRRDCFTLGLCCFCHLPNNGTWPGYLALSCLKLCACPVLLKKSYLKKYQ